MYSTATILTTTEKKCTEELTIRIPNRTLDEYEKSLPSSLRKRFRDIYNTLTEGIPNHRESDGCPLSAQQEKRAAFHQAAPSKMSPEQANGLNSLLRRASNTTYAQSADTQERPPPNASIAHVALTLAPVPPAKNPTALINAAGIPYIPNPPSGGQMSTP